MSSSPLMSSECTALVPSKQKQQQLPHGVVRRRLPGSGELPIQKVWRHVLMDFNAKQGGDHKILRAIGRTALVNLVVAATAVGGGPLAGIAGYATGGAITAKRVIGDGILGDNQKEVAKGLAVFGSATTASILGQISAGAVMVTVAGASLPVAAAVAFGVGCTSGITAGALSEWGVDSAFENLKKEKVKQDSKKENASPIESKAKNLPKNVSEGTEDPTETTSDTEAESDDEDDSESSADAASSAGDKKATSKKKGESGFTKNIAARRQTKQTGNSFLNIFSLLADPSSEAKRMYLSSATNYRFAK